IRCSTPRGITGKIAYPQEQHHFHQSVLNASRHHRKNRVSRAGIDKPRLHVLNASRHHRKNRSHDPRRTKHERRACSTPRGITGKIAVLLASNAPPVHSAQRLAASPEKSPRHRLNQRILIIVLNASQHHRKNRTPEKIIVDCCHLVLNASRHHRKNRWNDDRKHPTLRGCAQRLAASPEKSPSVAIWSHFAASGAQRLAASPEKSLARSSTTPASRAGAQRLAASPEKSPACAASDRRARSRAQRRAASPEKSPVPAGAKFTVTVRCSTPRGITGKIARSRHTRSQSVERCSTPRGITGKIAPAFDRQQDQQAGCAQRLAASPEKSPSGAFSQSSLRIESAQRLAASPEKSLSSSGPPICRGSSAQRLAASPEKSQ